LPGKRGREKQGRRGPEGAAQLKNYSAIVRVERLRGVSLKSDD